MFCGRVYIFMFQSFPLGDKSSVNLRGNFHVENVTTFEDFLKESNTAADDEAEADEAMQVDVDEATTAVKDEAKGEDRIPQAGDSDSDKAKDATTKRATLDVDTLYPVFWSLQHSFSNPPRLFEEDNFREFQKGLEATLAKFKEVPKVIQAGDSERKKGPKSREGDEYDAFANSYNPKYLTSRDLFRLEVRQGSHYRPCAMTDQFPAERRRLPAAHPGPSTDPDRLLAHINRKVQEQGVLPECAKGNAVSLYTGDGKGKWWAGFSRYCLFLITQVRPANCFFVVDCWLLQLQPILSWSSSISADDKAQTEWALGIKTAIANYLQEGPDGKFYYRMVDTVLSRDKNWVRWKMENCQPFTRERVPTRDFQQAKSGAQKAVVSKKAARPMGVPTMFEFLYNNEAEKGLSQLRQSDRFNVPSAEWYSKRVKMTELDMDMAEGDEEKRQLEEQKASHVWRGLRLASKKQLVWFDRMEPGKSLEALQPASSCTEAAAGGAAAGLEVAPTGSDDQGSVPQGEHQSVEEQRAGQHGQVTGDSTA